MARGSPNEHELPRHSLLREITDRTVLDLVLERGRVTRADVARETGISKPTISAAMGRLERAGLLQAAGTREGQPGRLATWYELAPTAGWVLGLDVDAEGVHLRAVDLAARLVLQSDAPPVAPGDSRAMVRSIRAAVRRALRAAAVNGPLRCVGMSVANAVRPDTGEVLSLPNTPFPEGLVDPRRVFAGVVDAPLVVENDINCAALAEHRAGAAVGVDNFAYLFVGAGLGMGVYVDGRLARGAHGTAGEIGYLASGHGPDSRLTLVSELGRLGFSRGRGSSAIDVDRVRRALAASERVGSDATGVVSVLGTSVGQIIADTSAVIDPELVILGGPLGTDPAVLAIARRTVAELAPSPVRIDYGVLGEMASLDGAIHLALDRALLGILDT